MERRPLEKLVPLEKINGIGNSSENTDYLEDTNQISDPMYATNPASNWLRTRKIGDNYFTHSETKEVKGRKYNTTTTITIH